MKTIKTFLTVVLSIVIFLGWTYFVWISGYNSGQMVMHNNTKEVFISILSQRGAVVPVYLAFDNYQTQEWDVTSKITVDDLILLEQISPDILWWYEPVLSGQASIHSPIPGGNFILR